MNIIIDSAIPFIEGVFEHYATVRYVAGALITAETVKDADALIIRTRTICNKELLDGSTVKHIATATIGYDHIDMEYCHAHQIEVTTAAGCNARGVLQWMGAALVRLSAEQGGWSPSQKSIGIVGVGNVGRLIEEYASQWGFEVICCDPPRAKAEGDSRFVEIEELLGKCDIVTFHTPLNEESRHLLNSENIKLLKPSAAIINTSRGEVIETEALRQNPSHPLLIDVWEGEPDIDLQILERALVATHHIAGYSVQGKANGTADVVRDVARHFAMSISDWYPEVDRSNTRPITWSELQQSIDQYFDITALSQTLKANPEEFEQLRNAYNYREEYF